MKNRKTIMRKLPSPLTIVTSARNGIATSAVITFLTQTSREPPMVTMAVHPDSEIYKFMKSSQKAVIHFPNKNQAKMTGKFFKIKNRTENSLNGFTFSTTAGYVHLNDISMYLDVDVIEIMERGDHHLFICEVKNAHLDNDYPTLNLDDTNWKYGG